MCVCADQSRVLVSTAADFGRCFPRLTFAAVAAAIMLCSKSPSLSALSPSPRGVRCEPRPFQTAGAAAGVVVALDAADEAGVCGSSVADRRADCPMPPCEKPKQRSARVWRGCC